jgi:pimeloyl-ACP methyl ester carboxylesterase
MIYTSFMFQGHTTREQAREAVAEHFPYYERSEGAAAFVRQVRSLDVRDTLAVADRIPGIGVPARIVWGAADQFQKIGYGYRLAYELGAPLDRVEDGKHFIPEDHPGRISAAVNALLEQLG